MKRFTFAIVSLVLLALAAGEAEAQCRILGRFRERRQARIAARAPQNGNGAAYGYRAGQGGCAVGECAVTASAATPLPIARPATPAPIYARR